MLNASQLADGWKQLLSRLGSAEELEATAKASGALLRRREIKSAADLLRLALAYGPCGMSLRTAAAWAATMGLGDLSDVAVLNRLRASADWLQEIVGWLLAQRLNCSSATPGRIIRLVDGTTISEPGSDRADWRLHYSYDPRSGRTVDCELTGAQVGEHLRRVKVTAGDIWLGDRNYAKGEGLHHVVQGGADFVVRVSWNSLSLRTSSAQPFDLAKRRTRRSGKPDPRSLIAAQYTIVATSLDEPAGQIFELYALRWQIEIAFKRLKSLLHIDRLEAKDPDLVRTWLLAHIIAALLIEDHATEALDSPPSALRYAA